MNTQKHMELFNSVKSPAKNYTKKIQAGRLKGMTDIKPQWRIVALTETYGLCGFGWKYEITKKEIVEGSDNQKVGFVDINLYVKIDDQWSDAIPGTGGSSFIANERHGLHTSDEVYKMALTDAISVAAKAIGVASDIYLGIEASKYEPKENSPAPKQKPVEKQLLKEGTPQFANCIEAMVNKGKTLTDIEQHYRLTDSVRNSLQTEAMKAI